MVLPRPICRSGLYPPEPCYPHQNRNPEREVGEGGPQDLMESFCWIWDVLPDAQWEAKPKKTVLAGPRGRQLRRWSGRLWLERLTVRQVKLINRESLDLFLPKTQTHPTSKVLISTLTLLMSAFTYIFEGLEAVTSPTINGNGSFTLEGFR